MSADLVRGYVETHNRGVRSGDYQSMLQLFEDDAEMHFDAAVIGPFLGLNAIREAFATRPPDDELLLLEVHGDVATYAWKCRPDEAAGKLLFKFNGDKIKSLTVTFRP